MSQSRPLALLVVAALVAAAVLVAAAEAQQADGNKLEGLADALKYLQELDRYYSQVARPRFGKRAELRPDVVDDVIPEEMSADKFWRRFARRR
uniref:Neuropeptide F n=2 Tax=Locusta migratoria TaxID=7004 RepID=NPF_LOCMI|nr:RecName: Full=Neuropeptide F; Short=Lom-NPF; Short=NPF; Short=longNPF; Flags: Precursor [Locusta migratoria]AYO24236.1 neuropeptide F 1 [Locusta migratoria]